MELPSLKNSTVSIKALFAAALAARLAVFGLLLASLGPGSFYLANFGASLSDNDSQNYVTIAKNLVEQGEYSRFVSSPFEPDSFRTPLLPLYFALFVYGFGFTAGITAAMLALQAVLALTAAFAYKFARLFLSHKYALWFGLAIALEPLLLYRSSIAEPDALIVALFLTGMYFFTRYWQEGQNKYLYWTAVFLGLMTLAKPVGMYAIILIGAFAAVRSRALKSAAVYFLIAAALISPWLVRNQMVFGEASVSSVTAYNFYNYYTDKIRLPGEIWPSQFTDRDPARNLAHADYFMDASLSRIKNQPLAYAKAHGLGVVKNFLASDLPGLYNNGHAGILPFAYNPHGELAHPGPVYILRHILLAAGYLIILYHWLKLYHTDKNLFGLFTLFLLLSFYFVFAAGNFVDAKYRLPAVPLLLVIVFHFWERRKIA